MNTLFKILWAFDALIALVILYFFFIGIADGSVSSFNIGLWIIILLVLAGVMAGSILLKSRQYHSLATALVLLMAIPGFLFLIFMLIMIVGDVKWQ